MRAILAAAILSTTLGTAHAKSPAAVCTPGAATNVQKAVIGGTTRVYTVCAGTLPIRDPKGEVRGSIFYTAYFLAGTHAAARPLSFIWNGGPGGDSRLLQFHALAPKVLRDGVLADNAVSPLPASDLVFVDPVGTSFSRPAKPEFGDDFYRTTGDIASIAHFVRTFRQTYRRDRASTYLLGESFGTWRAAGVAEALVDAGQPLAGFALISGGIPLGAGEDRATGRALSLPNRTATALALGKLSPEMQAHPEATLAEATEWASQVYRPALADPAALSDAARGAIVARLATFQGLPPATIDAKTLWISPRQFRTGLIPDAPRDIFDMRRPVRKDSDPADDRAVIDFYRRTLGYHDGRYAGIEEPAPDVNGKWRYDQSPITPDSLARAVAGEGPPSASQPWTLRAMQKAPHLRVLVATGRYDSLNSCAGAAATVASLPGDIGVRFTLHCYAGGHMMYEDPAVAPQFGKDVAAFLQN